jgi:hypothetical protein
MRLAALLKRSKTQGENVHPLLAAVNAQAQILRHGLWSNRRGDVSELRVRHALTSLTASIPRK